MTSFQPLRVKLKDVQTLLGLSKPSVYNLMKNDPTFPKHYKGGPAQQSHAFFDYQEIVDWHNANKQKAQSQDQGA